MLQKAIISHNPAREGEDRPQTNRKYINFSAGILEAGCQETDVCSANISNTQIGSAVK